MNISNTFVLLNKDFDGTWKQLGVYERMELIKYSLTLLESNRLRLQAKLRQIDMALKILNSFETIKNADLDNNKHAQSLRERIAEIIKSNNEEQNQILQSGNKELIFNEIYARCVLDKSFLEKIDRTLEDVKDIFAMGESKAPFKYMAGTEVRLENLKNITKNNINAYEKEMAQLVIIFDNELGKHFENDLDKQEPTL